MQTFGLMAIIPFPPRTNLSEGERPGPLRTLIFMLRLSERLKHLLQFVPLTTLCEISLVLPFEMLGSTKLRFVPRVLRMAPQIPPRLLSIPFMVMASATLSRQLLQSVLQLTAIKLLTLTPPLAGMLRGTDAPPLSMVTALNERFLVLRASTQRLSSSVTLPLAMLGPTKLYTLLNVFLVTPRVPPTPLTLDLDPITWRVLTTPLSLFEKLTSTLPSVPLNPVSLDIATCDVLTLIPLVLPDPKKLQIRETLSPRRVAPYLAIPPLVVLTHSSLATKIVLLCAMSKNLLDDGNLAKQCSPLGDITSVELTPLEPPNKNRNLPTTANITFTQPPKPPHHRSSVSRSLCTTTWTKISRRYRAHLDGNCVIVARCSDAGKNSTVEYSESSHWYVESRSSLQEFSGSWSRSNVNTW